MAPKQSKGATKRLRVINSVDPCVLKSNLLCVIVPLQLLVTRKQCENVAVVIISPGNRLIYLMLTRIANVTVTMLSH